MAGKPASFVKRNRKRTVACSYLKSGKFITKLFFYKFQQNTGIALSLRVRLSCNIFDFKNSFALVSYDTLSFYAAVIKNKHPAPVKIKVNHVFLLVSKQKKRKKIFFILSDFCYLHVSQTPQNSQPAKILVYKHIL